MASSPPTPPRANRSAPASSSATATPIPSSPREQVAAFQQEMDAVGANWHLHVYAGVKHGFTDPAADSHGLPALGYDASADRQSWAALLGLLEECLGSCAISELDVG